MIGICFLGVLDVALVILTWILLNAWLRADARRDALWDRVMDAIEDRYDDTACAVSKALREPPVTAAETARTDPLTAAQRLFGGDR